MIRKIFRTSIGNQNVKKVFHGFDKDLFLALTPPLLSMTLKEFDGCRKNDRIHLEITPRVFSKFKPYFTQNWEGVISEDGENFFVDEGLKLPWPLKSWRHHHEVAMNQQTGMTEIIDDVSFSTQSHLLDLAIYPGICLMFWLRKPVYRKYFRSGFH